MAELNGEMLAGLRKAEDGTIINADVVAMATGFKKNAEMVRNLFGKDIVAKPDGLRDLDDEQERTGW
ncbi:hypothetical protein V2A60_000095 [Cordyceps javanica]